MGRRGEIPLAVQAFVLRSNFPTSAARLRAGQLTWEGTFQPTEAMDLYTLRLNAREGRAPDLFVTAPELVPDGAGRLPHVFASGAICLHRAGEWRPNMLFIETVIPWAEEWLFFYELWRADGVWRGDGPDALSKESQQSLLHPYNPRVLPRKQRS